jgi:hypothetical protein
MMNGPKIAAAPHPGNRSPLMVIHAKDILIFLFWKHRASMAIDIATDEAHTLQKKEVTEAQKMKRKLWNGQENPCRPNSSPKTAVNNSFLADFLSQGSNEYLITRSSRRQSGKQQIGLQPDALRGATLPISRLGTGSNNSRSWENPKRWISVDIKTFNSPLFGVPGWGWLDRLDGAPSSAITVT